MKKLKLKVFDLLIINNNNQQLLILFQYKLFASNKTTSNKMSFASILEPLGLGDFDNNKIMTEAMFLKFMNLLDSSSNAFEYKKIIEILRRDKTELQIGGIIFQLPFKGTEAYFIPELEEYVDACDVPSMRNIHPCDPFIISPSRASNRPSQGALNKVYLNRRTNGETVTISNFQSGIPVENVKYNDFVRNHYLFRQASDSFGKPLPDWTVLTIFISF